ncbi:MAG: AraC family transcriptional regulator [Paracoccaceae bacterium]
MNRQNADSAFGLWRALQVPAGSDPPAPLLLRVETIPGRCYFPGHQHDWGQLVYAISGVLNVALDGRCFVIPLGQAVWLPGGTPHSVGSLHGAEFRSLYISEQSSTALPPHPTILVVTLLVRELIIAATEMDTRGELSSPYGMRVVDLIIDSLARLDPLTFSLPWPRSGPLLTLCEALFENPADERSQEEWARALGMSGRTLARRCEAELGTSLRSWERSLRLFRAIELLGAGASVTEAALTLGYSSTSAFIHMFRSSTGQSPRRYVGTRGAA